MSHLRCHLRCSRSSLCAEGRYPLGSHPASTPARLPLLELSTPHLDTTAIPRKSLTFDGGATKDSSDLQTASTQSPGASVAREAKPLPEIEVVTQTRNLLTKGDHLCTAEIAPTSFPIKLNSVLLVASVQCWAHATAGPAGPRRFPTRRSASSAAFDSPADPSLALERKIGWWPCFSPFWSGAWV